MSKSKFNLVKFNIEILEEFKASKKYSKKTTNDVISAFWMDYNHFGYKAKLHFKYSGVQSTEFEEGCKTLGDNLRDGYEKFTKKVENKKKVRYSFISKYFSDSKSKRCQFCGQIFESSGKDSDFISADLEHLIPKGQYPQYALHPNNLVPCCMECNRIEKGQEFNFNNDLSDFYDALTELNVNIKIKPLNLWQKFTLKQNKNFGWEVNLDVNSSAHKLICHYGLERRFTSMLGSCYNMIFTRIKNAKISSPEGLEKFLEYQIMVSKEEYDGVQSFNNSPHLWQDFLNEILYDRCKLEALWEEVKDYNSQLLLY